MSRVRGNEKQGFRAHSSILASFLCCVNAFGEGASLFCLHVHAGITTTSPTITSGGFSTTLARTIGAMDHRPWTYLCHGDHGPCTPLLPCAPSKTGVKMRRVVPLSREVGAIWSEMLSPPKTPPHNLRDQRLQIATEHGKFLCSIGAGQEAMLSISSYTFRRVRHLHQQSMLAALSE